ncbi:MAG: non-heme iron oxygenase ferredoxin subunit [Leptospiraceae bacterium]|nr:non-heme iron oxygenase ferredoxin subunit [Leptospiraceae bacterium]MCP5511502.1 non-heme iron oxygenase ferredoxin subunit [Leptospiraceae bacterium]
MYIKIAKIFDLEGEKILRVNLKYTEVAITRVEGEIVAFEDSCTHDGEEISSGEREGNCIICPRHLAKFDLKTGEALTMPATVPMKLFPTRIVGDDIEIETEEL